MHYKKYGLKSLKNEIWLPIKNWNGYHISNLGRIKADSRAYKKRPTRIIPQLIRKQSFDSWGYLHITLVLPEKTKTIKVHRLVAVAFHPNPENKPQINHKNGIKTDNRAENLEWMTRSENLKHAFQLKLRKPQVGTANNMTKLTEKQVLEIFSSNNSASQAGKIYNVTKQNVLHIRNKRSWKHLTNRLTR